MENNILEQYNKAFSYWEKKLLEIKSRTVFEPISEFQGNEREYRKFSFTIKDELFLSIDKVCKKDELLLFVFMLTVFKIEMDMYSFEGNRTIALPLNAQDEIESKNSFIPFICDRYMEKSFKELINDVKNELKHVYLYQNIELKEVLRGHGELSDIETITDISFAMMNIHSESALNSLINLKNNKFVFVCRIENQQIIVDFLYRANNDMKQVMLKLERNFKYLVENLIKNSNIAIGKLQLLEDNELNMIKKDFNQTEQDSMNNHKTLHELIEKQVQRTPDNVAVMFEDKTVSYRELDERANSLAKVLISKGAAPDSIIGISIDRSIEMIIAMLAVLKADAAYLPIDPETPCHRIEKIISECDAKMVLVYGENQQFEDLNVTTIDINKYKNHEKGVDRINRRCGSDNLAYVIFTSGSTGTPKGVMIEHKSIVNTLLWRKDYYGLNQEDSVLQIPGFYFDSSVEDIFTALISGARLVMIDKDKRLDANYVSNIIKKEAITHFLAVPNYYKTLLPYIYGDQTTIEKITVAGEAFTRELVKEHYKRAPGVRLINEYGPTENSVCSTVYEFSKERTSVLMGRPINNVKCYILNKNYNFAPIGIVGELYLSGLGVARGYINSEELNREKFINIPQLIDEKLYRTGDLARWNSEGNLEFVGRMDQQVKIRGYRVELGEIENALLEIDGIDECIVTTINEEEDKYICAYYIGKIEPDENVKHEVLKKIPEYIYPNNFVRLQSFPVNKNGKIDRKALPKPELNNVDFIAPRNKVEEVVGEIFCDVLKCDKVSVKDDFFELGGHSLKATNLIARLKRDLNVTVSLMNIFENSTIEDLSKYIDSRAERNTIKIGKTGKCEYYPLSSAQARIYNIQNINLSSIAYNIPILLLLKGSVEKERIEEILKSLIKMHAAFRTSFEMVNGVPVQIVHDNVDFSISYKEIKNESLIETVTDEFIQPFTLDQAPLIRALLIKQSKDKHYLMVDIHHIISDGASAEIIIDEFTKLYNSEELLEPDLEYIDYAVWQQEQKLEQAFMDKEEYWRKNFSGELPVLNLPIENTRPSIQTFDGDTLCFEIGKDLKEDLNKLAKRYNTTLFTVLLASFNILLYKLSGQEDIIVGVPTTGRDYEELKNVVGMFVNTLAIRSYPGGSKSFEEYLNEVQRITLESFDNQEFQFDDLIEVLKLKRDKSRNPIFDVMFAHQNIEVNHFDLKDLEIDILQKESKISKFDLLLQSFERPDDILFSLEYNVNLFNVEAIKRIIGYYRKIISEICKDSLVTLEKIEILSDEEKQRVLNDLSETLSDFPKDKKIHELFEQQVEKTPGLIAVSCEGRSLTYKELNELANSLAHTLIERGVGRERIVGLLSYNSIETIIGILGILKSGAAYLPIDPKMPDGRIKYIIRNSKMELLLVGEDNLIDNVESVEILNLKDEKLYENATLNIRSNGDIRDLAYVIYTSGTTGNPKGVMIEHKNVVNYIDYCVNKLFGNERHVVPLYSSIGFDLTVTALFPPLIRGDEIIVYRENDINRIMFDNKATLIKLTPSHMELIKDLDNSNSSVKTFIVGGEQLKLKLIQEVFNSFNGNIVIYNEYGPTETTVGCTIHKYDYFKDDKSNVSIGKPLQNTKIYILDKNNNLCPLGVQGELCISGVGVGRGYINNEVLTSEKFIENPFIEGERIYRTGDLARLTDGGTIEFLGRIDNQLKIKGFRIEASEIENALIKVADINQAVVLAVEKDEEKFLCAYYVGEVDDTGVIRELLGKDLPDYMIPMYFIKLDTIPLNQNGKVDISKLPLPENNFQSYIAPRNPLEKRLEGIFCEVLKLDTVGVTDDFFDLGGHSLKAMNLVARIKSSINTDVNLMDIFENSSIEKLCKLISITNEEEYCAIEKAEKKSYYPLSSAQKRIFVIQNIEPNSIAYNIPVILKLTGVIDKEKIENTFKKLINRHEAFRTSFEIIDESPVQRIWEEVDFNITYKSMESETNIEKEINEFAKAFDLRKAQLLRVALISLNSQEHFLMMDMHHIISDGASTGILIEEFTRLYSNDELREKSIEYKDYAVWQNSYKLKNKLLEEGEYWKRVLHGDLPVINLNYDFTRPYIQSFEGESFDFKIDKDLTEALRKVVRENDVTLFMVLLAGFKVLLYKYSGQEDIIVGTPISGRSRTELLDVVGMFVNVLAIRSYPKGDKTFRQFLGEMKKVTVNAFDNQEFQFEELVEFLNVRRDTSRSPIFDVMFSLENNDTKSLIIDSLDIEEYKRKNTISKFDLTLNSVEYKDYISFSIEYCKKLFRRETIERMAQHYINILKSVIDESDIKLCKINILTSAEEKFFMDVNANMKEYPSDKTFYMLFEEQVEKTPEKVAVVYKDKTLTYKELNSKANKLARHLRNIGVGKETKVAILLDRGIEMIVAVLGVMKSGGAYVPLDKSYPDDRINFILNDCQAMVLIKQNDLSHSLVFDRKILDIQDENIWMNDSKNLIPISFGENLIYQIYTSGTSGKPKGVMLEYRNITNISHAWRECYGLYKMEVNLLQFASFSFDVFCGDLCRALLNGGKLVICSNKERLDIEALYNIITMHEISIFESTPALIVELMNYIYENNLSVNSLKLLILGSDVCKVEDFTRINNRFGKEIRILNSYGLTETAIDSSFFEMGSFEELNSINVPIGKPMQNNKFYILDKNLNYVPIGVCGELYIGGEGLARGYVNNEELTSKNFIQNPFVEGERLYKTGDLARWLVDGNVEFIGREDTQVKIRGFRIEISEIENVLMKYVSINEAAVIPVEVNKDLYLCGYYSSKTDIRNEEIKEFLSGILPEYMIPTYFVRLDKLPINNNGKVSKRDLPIPIINSLEYRPPRNSFERNVADIWCNVLGVSRIGLDDSFFGLGGHSIKATILITKIKKELHKEIPLIKIFEKPRFEDFCNYLTKLSSKDDTRIKRAEEREHYPLSTEQNLMFAQHMNDDKNRTSCNMTTCFVLEGNIDRKKIEDAFDRLVQRHEVLRTSFHIVDGKPIQKVHEKVSFKIRYKELYGEEAINKERETFVKSFDISDQSLIRVSLIKDQEQKQRYIMLVDIHHIISDGITQEILLGDFMKIYNGQKLEPLSLQYKDYALWQQNGLNSAYVRRQKEYWVNKIKNFKPLEFKTDFSRPQVITNHGNSIFKLVDRNITDALKEIANKNNMTLSMLFMSVYNIFLYKYTKQDDITVAMPISIRNHDGLESCTGMFVGTILIRSKVSGNKDLKMFFEEVKQDCMEAYANQDYHYDNLLYDINNQQESNRYPNYDTMLNVMPDFKVEDLGDIDGDFTIKSYTMPITKSELDFKLKLFEYDDGLHAIVQYRTCLFKKSTIEMLLNDYISLLEALIESQEMSINGLILRSEELQEIKCTKESDIIK